MANTSRIAGFKPVEGLATGSWTALVRQYAKTAGGTSTDLFIGDVVQMDTTAADGSVIQAATAETAVVGVVVSLGKETTFNGQTGYFDPDTLSKRHLLAAEAGVVGIVPAELSLFEAYGTAAADLDLQVGDACDFALGTGNTTTGNSTYTIAANVNSDCTVVEQVTAPDNDRTLADARYIVKFNKTLNTL